MLTRTTDATEINRIFNHPAVRPFAVESPEREVDLSAAVGNPVNVSLVGEHGAVVFFKYCEGIYEAHANAVPEGRGEWMKEFTGAALNYAFCATDAVEILTRVPEGNLPSKTLAMMIGMRPQFEQPDCRFRGKTVPVTVYALSLQEWASRVDKVAMGRNFLQQIGGVVVNDDHANVVGVACEMMGCGMIRKAVVWINRWALATRQPTVALIGENEVRIGGGVITVANDGGLFFSPSH